MSRQSGPLPEGLDLSLQKPSDTGFDPRTKMPTKFENPCWEAAQQSMRCLDRNNHDQSKCHNEFLI